MSDADMIKRANAGVQRVQDAVLEALDKECALLVTLAGEQPTDLPKLYHVAVRINEIAATAGFKSVGRAAYSLCNLLDGQTRMTAPQEAAVALHISTIKRLRDDQMDKAGEKALLRGLQDLVLKFRSNAV